MSVTMRQQMSRTIRDVMEGDERLVVVLASISAEYFKESRFPERIINVGIMEQAMISVGAGLAMEGLIPVMHSIAPFLIERPFEQIKDDFCYQQLGGNFISIGASYDYSSDGMTHYGPGDVQLMLSLPGMQIVVPGTPAEFDHLFRETYANGSPTYFRLGMASNAADQPASFGKMSVVRRGTTATIIAVGPMLERTLDAVAAMDVTVLYCATITPFDGETLRSICAGGKIVLVEPYYSGALVPAICEAMGPLPVSILPIGVPREIISRYGTPQQHDEALGLTPPGIHRQIERFLAE